jgi:hypothetical protein
MTPVRYTRCAGNNATINYMRRKYVNRPDWNAKCTVWQQCVPVPVRHASTKNAIFAGFISWIASSVYTMDEKRPVVTIQLKSLKPRPCIVTLLSRMEVNRSRESLPPLKSNPLVRPCQTPCLGTNRAVADRGNYFTHLKWRRKRCRYANVSSTDMCTIT